MSVPKKRQSKSRTARRRNNIRASRVQLVACTHCQQPRAPHRVCTNCGYYRGRKVVDVSKRAKRIKKPGEES
ncbi:MAG: 50S ribosomal protein L32 [Patescibacteria group bacterium]